MTRIARHVTELGGVPVRRPRKRSFLRTILRAGPRSGHQACGTVRRSFPRRVSDSYEERYHEIETRQKLSQYLMLLGVFALVAGACTSDGDVAQKDFDAVSVELAAVQAELAARVAEVDTGTATIAARDAEIENAAVYLAAAGVEIEGGGGPEMRRSQTENGRPRPATS